MACTRRIPRHRYVSPTRLDGDRLPVAALAQVYRATHRCAGVAAIGARILVAVLLCDDFISFRQPVSQSGRDGSNLSRGSWLSFVFQCDHWDGADRDGVDWLRAVSSWGTQ